MIGEKAIKHLGSRAPGQSADTKQAQFDRVWQMHRPRLWRLAARLAGDLDLADDLTQEASARACAAWGTFRRDADAFTWLYRITVNVALRDRERRKTTLNLDASEAINLPAPDALSPEQTALQAETCTRVRAALDRLPDDLRATLILQMYEGLKYREIADALDIPLGTVKSRLNNALLRLREELKDYAL